jgi:hypothetical protein
MFNGGSFTTEEAVTFSLAMAYLAGMLQGAATGTMLAVGYQPEVTHAALDSMFTHGANSARIHKIGPG